VPSWQRWIAGSAAEGRCLGHRGLEDIDLDRYPALRFMRRAWELRANVATYDAAYVALTEILSCELWTADQRLANAPGPKCGICVLR
jgi:predicted nucleic acid-binding protein